MMNACIGLSVFRVSTVRIYHEFADRRDNSAQKVTVWHHKGQICLSFPQSHVRFFFLHTFGCQRLNKFSFTVK